MTKNKKVLGIGIIGGGFIARFHIRSWVGVRDADILGVFDPDEKRAREACALVKSLGVGEARPFASITDMAADPRIGALWICAPNFTRGEVMEEICHAVLKGRAELVGVTCEKPLGRNVREARKMLTLVEKAGLLDGYLENQVFSPAVVRGKEIVWARGAALSGPPYLARAAEEHSGPHMPWFWEGTLQGGGVLNDMMCHSVEEARFMLTPPGAPRDVLTPVSVTAYTNCLKWQEPKYAAILAKNSGGKTDYLKRPSEDFARSLVEYKDKAGKTLVVETTTSWCYVGAGLRLSMELLGPEYALQINTLDAGLKVFFSREVRGKAGEDLVEKQNAEIGLMPVVADEAGEYGYIAENRHMVQSFLKGRAARRRTFPTASPWPSCSWPPTGAPSSARPSPSRSRASKAISRPWPKANGTRKPSEIPGGAMKRAIALFALVVILAAASAPAFAAGPIRHISPELQKAVAATDYKSVRIKNFPFASEAWTFRKFTFAETLKKLQELGVGRGRSLPRPGPGGRVPRRPLRREHDRRPGRLRQGGPEGRRRHPLRLRRRRHRHDRGEHAQGLRLRPEDGHPRPRLRAGRRRLHASREAGRGIQHQDRHPQPSRAGQVQPARDRLQPCRRQGPADRLVRRQRPLDARHERSARSLQAP